MKKLFLIILLAPMLSFGQKFDITDLAGNSQNTTRNSYFQKYSGFSDQLSINYHISKLFSIGVFHDLTAWKPYTNTFGLIGDVQCKSVFFGMSIGELFPAAKTCYMPIVFENSGGNSVGYNYNPYFTAKPNALLSVGAHLGFEYKLNKYLVYKQEIEYSAATSREEYLGDNTTIKIRSLSGMAGLMFHF